MPHVSRKKVDKKVLDKIFKFLVVSLTDIKDEENMQLFMNSFFTDTEKVMLSKRLGVVFLLNQNVPTDKICKVLSITPATVSRMKLWLRLEGEGFKKSFSILEKSERADLFKDVLISLLNEIGKSPRTKINEMFSNLTN